MATDSGVDPGNLDVVVEVAAGACVVRECRPGSGRDPAARAGRLLRQVRKSNYAASNIVTI